MDEKNAVITGCSRGIGRAILECFVRAKINVWACTKTETAEFDELCTRLSETNGVWIRPIAFDFADAEAVKDGTKRILSDKAPIEILVNNAGILGNASLFSMTKIEDIKAQFDVNFFHPMLFTQKLLKNMMRHKYGSIINIASISGIDGYGVQFGYVASKAAVIGATKKLARELSPFNIRVNAIAPGVVDTDMAASMSDEQLREVTAQISMGRKATPSEIADAVEFLASEKSRYITGQVIRVDGGM